MLTIRREQMTLLEAYMAKRFRESVFQHVRQALADETKDMPDQQVVHLIDQGIQRGRDYGLSSERDLISFVDLMFAISPTFENTPDMRWAKKILLDKTVEGDVKMSLIYQRLAALQSPIEEITEDDT